jgi:hypothetical protein
MVSTGALKDLDVLDAEPLQLSRGTLELECLDYMLEDNDLEDDVDEEDVDYFPFANFKCSFLMDSTEILGDSLSHTIHENEKTQFILSVNAKRDPSSISQLARRRFIPMNAINFDPPTSIRDRQASHSDVSVCSGCSTSAKDFEAQYSEALHSLAESMKRSEESRKYVVKMKREVLTPEQQAALLSAKTMLEKQNQQVQTSFVAALGESHKKLGMYLGHMSQQTL